MPLKRNAPPPDTTHPPLPGEERAEPKTPLVKRLLLRIAAVVMIVLALVLCYVFLLLGEPDEDAKYAPEASEEAILMPMSPFEAPGESNVENLADTFGEPVLALYGGPAMYKARVYDTAFEGGYARRVTLTYTFEDGTQLTVESLRPTSAVTLLKGSGARLDASALYSLGGLNAARMDTEDTICVFGQTSAAVYAVLCPVSHEEALDGLLKQTMLVEAAVE